MKWNAFCILAIAAICILVYPALSQGDGQPGNMNRGGMGPNQEANFNPDQNDNSGFQNSYQPQGQADDPLRFMGCSTWAQKMGNKKPNDNMLPNQPDGANDDGRPGSLDHDGAGQQGPQAPPEGGDNGFGFPPGDEGRPRPLLDGQRPEMPPMKSIMDGHKNVHRPLIDKDHPGLPPKKSIMPKLPKKMPRSLMEDGLPKLPPMRSIMDFQG